MKTLLLVAAGLCVGTSNAWAYEVPSGYSITNVILGNANYTDQTITSVGVEDFSSAESITGWTTDDNVTVSLGEVTEVAKANVNSVVTSAPTYVSGKCIKMTRTGKSKTTLYATYSFSAVSNGYLVFNGDTYNDHLTHPHEIMFVDSEGKTVLQMYYTNSSGAVNFLVYNSAGTQIYSGCSSIARSYSAYGINDLAINLSTGACTMTLDYTGRANSANTRLQTVVNFNIGTEHNIAGIKIGKHNENGYDTSMNTYLDNVSLYHVTSAVTYYTATFTANAGTLTPSVTIYSDEDRTTSVTNGELTNGSTYYYTASLDGYNDYESSFTVNGANPSVNFTMTAKTRYTFKVNTIDENSNVIEEIYTDNDSWDGKTHDVYFKKYYTDNSNKVTYSKDNTTYYTRYTSASAEATQTVSYTAYTGDAYFLEGETVLSAGNDVANGNLSSGHAKRNFTDYSADYGATIFTIPSTGFYNITYAVGNNNVNNALTITLYDGTTQLDQQTGLQYVSVNKIKDNGTISISGKFLTAGDELKIKSSTANGFLDYIFIENTDDVSSLITNPGMETAGSGSNFQQNVEGWNNCGTVTNYRQLAISSFSNESGAFTGTYAFENWRNATDGGLSGQMSQTISNIPNGTYKLQLAAMVNTVNGQFIYGKSGDVTYKKTLDGTAGKTADYSVMVCVIDNTLEIGLDMNNSGVDWAAIDNARLTYMGEPVTATTTSAGKGWATLYTDKALDFSSLSESLTAYTATVNGTNVTLNAVESIPANTGVVLKSSTTDADATYSIPVIASSSTAQGSLQGSTTEDKAATSESPIYILKINDSGNAQFMRATYGSLDAGKAYLEIANGGQEAKALTVVFANDPTGIANVNAAETVQPVKRIVNGQLVIEKNGKRYNAAGAEL